MKKQISCRIEEDILEYAEYLAEELNISKTGIPEFALRILSLYFDIEQLRVEAQYNAPSDGRRKKSQG